ncbi:hypothetical protein F5Y11DRAFT_259811 [Daldinia sp. FL1419]|nr:hypothetical protein F5Y11DRAFT_259811 [Daldinia sp. FL1419]
MAGLDCVKVLSKGIMVGAAMFLPVFQHEDPLYRYLILWLFGISTFVHNALIWEAVVDYFFMALVVIVTVILITIPRSNISIYFLLGRIPLLIALMSLFVEECSRRFNQNGRRRRKAPDPKLIPPDDEVDMDKHPVLSMLNDRGELLSHMTGGEMGQYTAPSQHSSEISLSNIGPGRLPSSCGSMVRNFWHDESESLLEYKRGEELEDRNDPDPSKDASFC